MRVFEEDNGSFRERVNFVDENNVYVGYDMSQCCCEHAGYFFTLKAPDSATSMDPVDGDDPLIKSMGLACKERLERYRFNVDYCVQLEDGDCDNGGNAIFKLEAEGLPDLYLVLFNVHNGYYGHGFTFEVPQGTMRKDGYL